MHIKFTLRLQCNQMNDNKKKRLALNMANVGSIPNSDLTTNLHSKNQHVSKPTEIWKEP